MVEVRIARKWNGRRLRIKCESHLWVNVVRIAPWEVRGSNRTLAKVQVRFALKRQVRVAPIGSIRTYYFGSNRNFWAVAQFRESARFLRDLAQKRYFQVF